MAQKETHLGINTLERKHEQRESKTALLLALRDDVTALKNSLAEEKALTARLTQWIQTTLKPSVKQLRQEMIQGHAQLNSKIDETASTINVQQGQIVAQFDSKLSNLAAGTEKAFARTEAHIEQHNSELHNRISESEATTNDRLNDTNAHIESLKEGTRDRFLHVDHRLEETAATLTQNAQRFCLENVAASEQRMAQSTNETLAKWADRADEAMKGWREQQSQTITAFIESQLREHTEWQQALLQDVNAQHKSAMQATQAALVSFAESELSARKEWEQLKEKWFSSFLEDQRIRLQSAFSEAFREYSHMWNEWRKKSEGQFLRWREAHEGSVHDAELRTAESIDALKLDQARAAEDLKIAVQSEQRDWEDVFSSAVTQYAGSVGTVLAEWSESRRALAEQSSQVSRQLFNVWEEKRRNEEASHADPAQLVPDEQFPVPRWMQDLLESRGLAEYGPSICKRGFDTPTVFAALNAADAQAAGVTVPGHQKALLLLCTELDASAVPSDILYQQKRVALLSAAKEELASRVESALQLTERKREALDARHAELLAEGTAASERLAQQMLGLAGQFRSTVEVVQEAATEKQDAYLRESVMRLEDLEGANSQAALERERYFAEIAVRAKHSGQVEAETAEELFKEMSADAISKIASQFVSGGESHAQPQQESARAEVKAGYQESTSSSIARIMALDQQSLTLSTLVEQDVGEAVGALEALRGTDNMSLRELMTEVDIPSTPVETAVIVPKAEPKPQQAKPKTKAKPKAKAKAKPVRAKKPHPNNRRAPGKRAASKRAVPPPPKKAVSPVKAAPPAKEAKERVSENKAVTEDDDFWSALSVTAGDSLLDDVSDALKLNAGDVQGNAKHSYVGSMSLIEELRLSKQDNESTLLATIRERGERDPTGTKRWRIMYGALLQATATKFEGLPLLLQSLKKKGTVAFKDTGTFADQTVIALDEE